MMETEIIDADNGGGGLSTLMMKTEIIDDDDGGGDNRP
jgi:hypothetical protein